MDEDFPFHEKTNLETFGLWWAENNLRDSHVLRHGEMYSWYLLLQMAYYGLL